ncbi:HAMP domain-containing protein [Pleurocapsales cyanobacterium LEGE 10410]|nr:HAMP domain-containing protein [Pleurocapsales cyanobacterium LEGE 10410]
MIKNRRNTSYKFQSRILIVYCLLIVLSFSGAVLTIRRLLLFRLHTRIEQALNQEIKELRILVDSKDPETARPFGDNITAIFNVFLQRNVPITDEYKIALLGDSFYASVPAKLPKLIDANSAAVKHWQQLTVPERGRVSNSAAQIVYLAEPVELDGEIKGVFVIAIATQNERQKVKEAILIIIRVTTIAVFITSILAWIFAGKILTPLRQLTDTSRAIGENNLEQRIQVRGNDEIAQLGSTFNDMLDRLSSAFFSQRQFLNDVSHELKTPITIIQGHLELMGNSYQEQQETKEIVVDELERMSRLIADLTILAKSEQPNFLHLETLDLGSLTQEIYLKTKALADRNWQLEALGRGKIVADRQRIVQAITNLAQNATKHTKPEDTIAIGSTTKKNFCFLWVRDTGTGIAEADRQRIFQRFQTGANNYGIKSTGLGLAIVTAIAKAHGGRIELDSCLDRGSKFTLVLPLG